MKNQLSNEKELEYLKKINKLQEFQTQIEIEKNIIRDFESIIRIKFSGKWNNPPYPYQIFHHVNDQYYIELQGKTPDLSIKFYATEPYQFRTINSNSAIFESKQAVQKDIFPIGKTINELSSIDKIIFQIPLICCENIEDRKIIIEQVEIIFFVNSEKHVMIFNKPSEISTGNYEGAAFLYNIPQDTLKNVLVQK